MKHNILQNIILYDSEKGIQFKDLNSDSSTSHRYRLGLGASESRFFHLKIKVYSLTT